jgi:hypothetical protein
VRDRRGGGRGQSGVPRLSLVMALDRVDDLAGYFFGVPPVTLGIDGGQAGGLGADLVCGHGGDHGGGRAKRPHLLLGEHQVLASGPLLDAGTQLPARRDW